MRQRYAMFYTIQMMRRLCHFTVAKGECTISDFSVGVSITGCHILDKPNDARTCLRVYWWEFVYGSKNKMFVSMRFEWNMSHLSSNETIIQMLNIHFKLLLNVTPMSIFSHFSGGYNYYNDLSVQYCILPSTKMLFCYVVQNR